MLVNFFGILGIVVMAAGLAVLMLRWNIAGSGGSAPPSSSSAPSALAIVILSIRSKYDLLAYSYVFLITLLALWQIIEGLTRIAHVEPYDRDREPEKLTDSLRRARALEHHHNYIGAIQAYDLHLEEDPADVPARIRLAEALLHTGNSKRAIAVLTVAFAQSQDPRERVRVGVRLAEMLLVARRDPLAARAQLEQVRAMYAGTENEATSRTSPRPCSNAPRKANTAAAELSAGYPPAPQGLIEKKPAIGPLIQGDAIWKTERIIGIVLLALGIVLLVIGYNASQSVGEQVREGLTGRFSDATTWYIIGGVVGIVAGGSMLLFGGRHHTRV